MAADNPRSLVDSAIGESSGRICLSVLSPGLSSAPGAKLPAVGYPIGRLPALFWYLSGILAGSAIASLFDFNFEWTAAATLDSGTVRIAVVDQCVEFEFSA